MENPVYIVALVLGAIMLLSVCFVYVKHQVLQLGGICLSGFAVMLVGMSVWKSIDVSVDVNGIKAKLDRAIDIAEKAKSQVAQVKEISLNNSKASLALMDTVTIFKAQAALQNTGYYKGGIDGHIGVATQKSILSFQETKKLPKTGVLDLKTISELNIEPIQNFQTLQKNLTKSSRGTPASPLPLN